MVRLFRFATGVEVRIVLGKLEYQWFIGPDVHTFREVLPMFPSHNESNV